MKLIFVLTSISFWFKSLSFGFLVFVVSFGANHYIRERFQNRKF